MPHDAGSSIYNDSWSLSACLVADAKIGKANLGAIMKLCQQAPTSLPFISRSNGPDTCLSFIRFESGNFAPTSQPSSDPINYPESRPSFRSFGSTIRRARATLEEFRLGLPPCFRAGCAGRVRRDSMSGLDALLLSRKA
jgi:hypothetical protein